MRCSSLRRSYSSPLLLRLLDLKPPLPRSTGAGSTFVYPVLAKWAADFETKTGNKVNYQSIGSGRGLQQIRAATVDFGASDMPMKPEDLAKFGMGQFPLVIGGVVPVVKVDGVKPGEIRFSGPVLADIFLGKIKNWNDPAIQSINPQLKTAFGILSEPSGDRIGPVNWPYRSIQAQPRASFHYAPCRRRSNQCERTIPVRRQCEFHQFFQNIHDRVVVGREVPQSGFW